MQTVDVLVVGGGAAGCLAAGRAAQDGARVLLLERNARVARKVGITGKGRCNVTNASDVPALVQNVPGNGRFLYSAFSAFSAEDTMRFFTELGVPLKVERGNRVFPQSDRAADIVDALARYVQRSGAQRRQARVTALLLRDGAVRGVQTEAGDTIQARCVVLATGGLSYPATGSTGDGYRLAQAAGHTIVPTRPSLSALRCREDLCKTCAGLSLRNVALTVEDTQTHKTVYTDFGEMLFTHFGVSGPMVLSASAHLRAMRPDRYRLFIDLKPALSEEKLDLRLLRDFSASANRTVANTLGALLPRSLIAPVLRLAGIDGAQKTNQIDKTQRRRLLETVKALPLTVQGFFDIEAAVITAGGVCVREVEPKTMASKLCRGLYIAGELLDCDAYTGGFNLQIAFSTGYCAGRAAARASRQTDAAARLTNKE